MTPLEIVTAACSYYSRPDLVTPILTSQFANFLRDAHAIDNWAKDRRLLYVLNPTSNNGVVSVNLQTVLPNLRDIISIVPYSNYSQIGSVITPMDLVKLYQKYISADKTDMYNYYGAKRTHTWQILGANLSITDVDASTLCLEVLAFMYPSYTQNLINGQWETDSWIMTEWPNLLQCYCNRFVSLKLKDRELQNAAIQEFNDERTAFIAAKASEIISWQ
jgi:hypothetical protein